MPDNETFTDTHFTLSDLADDVYENCVFEYCSFEDIGSIIFVGCSFNLCNMSNARVNGATLNQCIFHQCKLLGIHFEDFNQSLFQITARDTDFSYSTFTDTNLSKMSLSECRWHDVDFTNTNLSGSILKSGDFLGAKFESTNLEKATMLGSQNYKLDPKINKITGAFFNYPEVLSLLDTFKIHIE